MQESLEMYKCKFPLLTFITAEASYFFQTRDCTAFNLVCNSFLAF